MTQGKRIKYIRVFRKITQKEFGIRLGFDPSNADIRISQYESDSRKSIKEPMLRKMAEILNVKYNAIKEYEFDNPTDIMECFFWLEEENPSLILPSILQAEESISSGTLRLPWSAASSPLNGAVALAFPHGELREYMIEWIYKFNELIEKKLSTEEYFEWKLQWNKEEHSI